MVVVGIITILKPLEYNKMNTLLPEICNIIMSSLDFKQKNITIPSV